MKQCVLCGKSFEVRSSSHKYCSEACQKKAKLKRDSEAVKKPKAGQKEKRKFLSIDEVLRIGRENGIYGYSEIVKFIEDHKLDEV